MKSSPRLFGAHESVSGGLHTAFERIASVGGLSLQIFTRNQRQWQAPPVTEEETTAFRAAWEKWGGGPVASHASYLINPASPDPDARARSARALAEELARCRALGVPWVVLHPGSALGASFEEAARRAASTLDEAIEADGPDASGGAVILLENTAGQGSGIGSRLEELAAVASLTRYPERLGFCLDTCHAWAAGYDVATARGVDAALGELDVSRLKIIHVNDSKGARGSRLDRHEHIGEGTIGLDGFRAVVNHPVLAGLPLILETHKEKNLAEDVRNLKTLRSLVE